MKLFKVEKVKDIDQYTIKNEPVSSDNLMERAANQMYKEIIDEFGTSKPYFVVAGPGNNGGDGLVIARLLHEISARVTTFLLNFAPSLSEDCERNFKRLRSSGAEIIRISDINDLPELPEDGIIIDAIFGAGLSRPVKKLPGNVIAALNKTKLLKISVDSPSGMFGEDNSTNDGAIFEADITLALQFPSRSFFFKENYKYTGKIRIIDIGLHPEAISKTESDWEMLESKELRKLKKKRNKFDHKGNYGHSLLIAGSYGKMGAAVLAARACLKAGTGLLTVHIPEKAYLILQQSVPEAMLSIDRSELIFTGIENVSDFDAVGIGPGLNTKINTQKALSELIRKEENPMVLDADALNIISTNKPLLNYLPEKTILTPHPGEFDRLFGKTENSWKQTEKLVESAKKYNLIIILKGAYTKIAMPDGKLYVNNTGNPGMATAGSGDVLTGIVLSLLAQKYKPEEAALLSVWIHGRAGDLIVKEGSEESLVSGEICEMLTKVFKELNV